MPNKKKVLIFIDWFLPGFKAGGPITSIFNLIDHLNDKVNFYILTRNTDYLENIPYNNIKSDKWVQFSNNTQIYYLSNEKINLKNIKSIIEKTDFDIAYVNGIYSFYFSILPIQILKKLNKKVIISPRGMLSKHSFARKKNKKRFFLTFVKILNFYKKAFFHATNENEQKDIQLSFKTKKIYVIPNLPRNISNISNISKTKKENEVNLISIARISQEKNTKFALEILSEIKDVEIYFDIYGSIYDKEYWLECQKIIKNLPKNIKVNYLGTIETSEVPQFFSKYHFSFMPSLGENFGHSLFESLTAGTPIITSSNTPWRDLQKYNAGWDIDLNDKKSFIDIIEFIAKMNQQKYNLISNGAYNYSKSILKNKSNILDYINMFENL